MTLHMEEWKNIINDDGNVDFFDYSISLINPILKLLENLFSLKLSNSLPKEL